MRRQAKGLQLSPSQSPVLLDVAFYIVHNKLHPLISHYRHLAHPGLPHTPKRNHELLKDVAFGSVRKIDVDPDRCFFHSITIAIATSLIAIATNFILSSNV